ncbi:zinc finger, CCHC-type containing protein [Tanacetum coccineum]
MRTTTILVPTRNQSWNVENVARLVTLRGIAKVADAIAWWIDSGATTHVCKDRCWFKTYKPVEDEFVLYIGFGYYNNDMFMLNLNKVPDDSDSVYMSFSSTVVNSSLWHASLGHVHYKRMLEMSKDDLIPTIDENSEKCTTYMDDHYDEVPSEIPEPRKGKRVQKAKSYGSDFQLYLVEGSRDHVGSQYLYCYSIEEDPRTYDEALQSRDAAFWKEAIDDEIGSIMENYTWVLSDLPPGCKPLGFRQKEKIDYFHTYAPVARITTIKLLLALAAIHNLVIHQMDVKTAFLNGDLDEEVYMKQPEGFVMPGNEHKVCKLVKSLYGLKQAPKQWHQKFDEVVLSSGFHLNQSDKCVYSKFDSSGKGVIICLYVDDMLIFGTDQNQVDKTKKFLSSRFSMKDMGEADVILGIKIKRENKGIVITQSHYIEKILKKFNREDCSLVSTSMDPIENTKPDIAYAVGLSYMGYPSVLEGYSDASLINHVEDSSSTSGWMFLLGGGAILWASKKQTCITGSTIEYEFVALAAAGKEAEWIRNLIHEILI